MLKNFSKSLRNYMDLDPFFSGRIEIKWIQGTAFNVFLLGDGGEIYVILKLKIENPGLLFGSAME